VSSKLETDGCYSSQWWRRLVNAYEVNVGMVCLQCKNCVSFRAELLTMERYTNLCTFYSSHHLTNVAVTHYTA